MKKQRSDRKIQVILWILFGILAAVFMTVLCLTPNGGVEFEREKDGYTIVSNVHGQETEKDPGYEKTKEYRFLLEEDRHADTLMFYTSNCSVTVFLDEECAYRMTAGGRLLRTSGNVWVKIPLHAEDAGKTVCVRLSSRYPNAAIKQPDFLLGSAASINRAILTREFPELLFSLGVIFIGIYILLFAIYCSLCRRPVYRLYAISVMALAAGIWRMSYGRLLYLVFEDDTELLYIGSIFALMVVSMAMLFCADTSENPKLRRGFRGISIGYCVCDILQLVVQLLGWKDLKQMLPLTHLMLIGSALLLLAKGLLTEFFCKPDVPKNKKRDFSWLLGMGAIIDLFLYYFAMGSEKMLILQGAFLVFAVLEGVGLLIDYSGQKIVLRELERELTLSRAATMMSQIRSHFVFNILNAISGMCKYDPEKADETVVRFARYLRNNISIMEDDSNIPFTTDLKRLEDYVILEQIRFGDRLEFYTDIEADQFLLPPLILQPVVENAIKHGISRKQDGGTIVLRTRETADAVVITVEDDGVGFEESELEKKGSVGLNNIRFRLKHKGNGRLEIHSEVGKGTVVTITIQNKCSIFGGGRRK